MKRMGTHLLDSKDKTGKIPEKLRVQKNRKNPKLPGVTLCSFRLFQPSAFKTFDSDVLRG